PVARVNRVSVRPMIAVHHVRRVGVVGIEPGIAEITAVQVMRAHDPGADVDATDARGRGNDIADRPDVEAAAVESRLDEDPPGAEGTAIAVVTDHDHVPANRNPAPRTVAAPRAPTAPAAPRPPTVPLALMLPRFDPPAPLLSVPPLALIGLGGEGGPQQNRDAEGAHEGFPDSTYCASDHENNSFPACGELPQRVRVGEKATCVPS